MLLAVLADIHANRQAFSACLDLARSRRRGAERIVCLGPIPSDMAPIRNGRLILSWALSIAEPWPYAATMTTPSGTMHTETMNAEAQAAIEWTRGRLSAVQQRFTAEIAAYAAGG